MPAEALDINANVTVNIDETEDFPELQKLNFEKYKFEKGVQGKEKERQHQLDLIKARAENPTAANFDAQPAFDIISYQLCSTFL